MQLWSRVGCSGLPQIQVAHERLLGMGCQACRGSVRWHFGEPFCLNLNAAQSHWTPPAWLCPELCWKLQLEAASVGKHSAACLCSSTPCPAAPATPHLPSPNAFQAGTCCQLISVYWLGRAFAVASFDNEVCFGYKKECYKALRGSCFAET